MISESESYVQWQCGPQASGFAPTQLAKQKAAPKAAPGERRNTKTHDLLSTMIGLFLGHKQAIGYKPGSVIDKIVNEAVEHLKDWPYPEAAPQQEVQEPVAAIHIGWDYLDSGKLVATYAVPVPRHIAPRLYTAPQSAPAPLSDDAKDAARWRLVETASSEVTLRLHNLRPDRRAQYIDAALAAQKDTA